MAKLKDISRGVGKRILKLRVGSELSRTEFGDLIGVSARYIDMLERGERLPSQALLIAMAVKFDFSENYLRTGRKGRGKWRPWETWKKRGRQ